MIFISWTHVSNWIPSQEKEHLPHPTGLPCPSFQSLTTRVKA